MMLFCTGCSKEKNVINDGAAVNQTVNSEGNVSKDSNVLIVYFSHSGNTEKLSDMISDEIKADVFRIVPELPYGEDLFERAQNELNDGVRPALSNHIEADAMSQYDVILLGFPVWWYDLPMPVWSFLEEYDLAGKTIVPYFTHNGSAGGAGSLKTVISLCPNSDVRADDYLSIPGASVDDASKSVKDWIAGLGL